MADDSKSEVAVRLLEIRDRYRATTPGEWWNETHVVHAPHPSGVQGATCHPLSAPLPLDSEQPMWDAEFAAQAHQDVPWLLDLVGVLFTEVTQLRQALQSVAYANSNTVQMRITARTALRDPRNVARIVQ